MRKFILAILILFVANVSAEVSQRRISPVDADDNLAGKRGWMFKACYNQQSSLRWVELGFGRINILSYRGKADDISFAAGAAAFTLGSDIGFADTSLIYSVKMGMEAHLTLFGGRVTYGYYMQDDNATGVIGIEGGFCIFSVAYVYGGYNFVKGNQENPVITEGAKLSVGLNIPFGMRSTEPVRKIGS